LSRAKPEVGTYLAHYGTLLRGDGKGNFEERKQSGFHLKGDVRDLMTIKGSGKSRLVAAVNNDVLKVFEY
jgi:enediyne biosynthesis protein E4